MTNLDDIDIKLLKIIQQDASLSIKELSSKVGLSATPTYERIKRMQTTGLIKKNVALVDRDKLGKSLLVYCAVSLKEQAFPALKSFENNVAKLDEVMEFYCMSGVFDYLLKIITEDMQTYHEFVMNKLANIQNIANLQSSFVLREIKYDTAYPILWKVRKIKRSELH